MQDPAKKTLILTLRLDAEGQAFFNAQRKLYFPPERNFLNAHLTLFHQLPNQESTFEVLNNLQQASFELRATGLMNLGAGVAYRIEGPELLALHSLLGGKFKDVLIPQDRQGFRPHVVVMNKQTPEGAKTLLNKLSQSFAPFTIMATGLTLWVYMGGPWTYLRSYDFSSR